MTTPSGAGNNSKHPRSLVRSSTNGRVSFVLVVFARSDLQSDQISNSLPPEAYRLIPKAGYLSIKFCRSLFPNTNVRRGSVASTIPFFELPSLNDALCFRSASEELLSRALRGELQPEPLLAQHDITPRNEFVSRLQPQVVDGIHPVLYQVIAFTTNALVLEAKDFFVFLPDRRDLHCILLDKFAYNIESSTFGYSKDLVLMRDFIWIYDLTILMSALAAPETEIELARGIRAAAVDPGVSFFFRAKRFTFDSPPVWSEKRFGIVLRAPRVNFHGRFLLAVEDTPEAVSITRSMASFPLRDLRDGDFLEVECRRMVPSSVRFSEPAVSPEARDILCHKIKSFLALLPSRAVLPMAVSRPPAELHGWLQNRLSDFNNYCLHRAAATPMMGRIFNVSASALAAFASMDDDQETHRVVATVPNINSFPLQLVFELHGMNAEAGWKRHRIVEVWAIEAKSFIRTEIESSAQDWQGRRLAITLRTTPWSYRTLRYIIVEQGRRSGITATVQIYVRLGVSVAEVIPTYEAVAQMNLLTKVSSSSVGRAILDAVYGATELTFAQDHEGVNGYPPSAVVSDAPLVIRDRSVSLTNDQRLAVALGLTPFPIAGIQAAFGTGKTVVAATKAARLAREGHHVLLTATTNTAVAQITETSLSLRDFTDIRLCRFIAETVALDENVSFTAADMHEILKSLPDRLKGQLEESDLEKCKRFRRGRSLLEAHWRGAHRKEQLSIDEQDELLLAERDVSALVEHVVRLLFQHFSPQVVAITTASLLNSTSGQGIFGHYLDAFDIIICDEASQVPEPVFAALISRLPRARQIFVSDVHQLEPYARCSRQLSVVRFGGRSVMDVLTHARAVPMAPLVTTFRAHPRLNCLPDHFAYGGTLQSSTA
ncbi:hypothetical protein Q1695_000604 [Nippostrongylus brasiliensis]|nr:hypothetical protein Q1695_000604 [Nippostrongylus brasiliensis]